MIKHPPIHGKARLSLSVTTLNAKGKEVPAVYTVHFLLPHPEVARLAIRLVKLGKPSDAHDVSLGPYGPTCDCGDFHWRRDSKDRGGCKHIASLRAVGLLPPLREASPIGEARAVN